MNKIIKKWIAIFIIAVNLALFSNYLFRHQSISIAANTSNNECQIDSNLVKRMKVVYVTKSSGNTDSDINMGDRVDVAVKFLELEDSNSASSTDEDENKDDPAIISDLKTAIYNELITPNNLVLYLNSYALKGSYSEPIGEIKRKVIVDGDKILDVDRNILREIDRDELKRINQDYFEVKDGFRFLLERTDDSEESWNAILGGGLPKLWSQGIDVDVSLGCENQLPVTSTATTTIYLNNELFFTTFVIYAVIVGSFFLKLRDVLKDSSKRNKNHFSLARMQMAWWFFIIVGSFLYIYVRTGDFTNVVNPQAWVLLGISATTGVSAALIDNQKDNNNDQVKSTKKEDTSISLLGFVKDLLTNDDKFSFHRYQIFVWTIFLGIIFVVRVLFNLEFPEFDANLLTLQGISAGTYLGFKFPEEPKSS